MNNENKYNFAIEDMTCASCVRIVEKQLNKVPGVEYVSVNLATEKAYVVTKPEVNYESLSQAVAKSGYKPREDLPGEDELEKRFRNSRFHFMFSLSITLPLMVMMILHMQGIHIPGMAWMEFAGGSIVLFYSGRRTLRGAFIALIHKHTNMDTLVSLGAFSAWITSVLALTSLTLPSYGSLTAMLIAFHLTGRYMEARLKYKASQEIRQMLSLQSTEALVLDTEGNIHSVPVESVRENSLVRVRQGDQIPLDGIITEGGGLIDEAMVTGEPVPAFRKQGDELIGGTILIKGNLTFTVTHTGDNTFLSRIIKLVEEAQSSKVPIQALADKVTQYFIGVVMSLAVLATAAWLMAPAFLSGLTAPLVNFLPWMGDIPSPGLQALTVFISVLVIACPCALGLATPMALVAGSGAAARKGILIKNGEAMQSIKNLDTVFLDKTGTLTEGRPVVTENTIHSDFLSLILTMETISSHPLAGAILEYGKQQHMKALETEAVQVEEIAGQGLKTTYENRDYFLGKPTDSGLYKQQMEKGQTIIEFREETLGGTEILGFMALADTIRPEARETIDILKKMNITPIMLTGDQEATALAIGRELGIDGVIAGVKPEEKYAHVLAAQKKGEICAMVGDGINDAAALKGADIGIAMGTGSDISVGSADMVLMN